MPNKNWEFQRSLCSNINNWLTIIPENLHSTSISTLAFAIGIKHTDSSPRGNVNGIRKITSSLRSPVNSPLIVKVPFVEDNEVSIEWIIK